MRENFGDSSKIKKDVNIESVITSKDIQNLASLARIEISADEAESLTPEIDSILGYVSQVENMSASHNLELPALRNVMREDAVTRQSSQYTEDILSNAPSREDNLLKVKKILG